MELGDSFVENILQGQNSALNKWNLYKKSLKKILKCTKIVFTFSDGGTGFGEAHHSNPIFMPFPKWYSTYSAHLTLILSLFFRRVRTVNCLGTSFDNHNQNVSKMKLKECELHASHTWKKNHLYYCMLCEEFEVTIMKPILFIQLFQ